MMNRNLLLQKTIFTFSSPSQLNDAIQTRKAAQTTLILLMKQSNT